MFLLKNRKESFEIFFFFLYHEKVERPQPVKQAIKHVSQARGPCQHPLKRDAQVCCLYILHMRYQFAEAGANPVVIPLEEITCTIMAELFLIHCRSTS